MLMKKYEDKDIEEARKQRLRNLKSEIFKSDVADSIFVDV